MLGSMIIDHGGRFFTKYCQNVHHSLKSVDDTHRVKYKMFLNLSGVFFLHTQKKCWSPNATTNQHFEDTSGQHKQNTLKRVAAHLFLIFANGKSQNVKSFAKYRFRNFFNWKFWKKVVNFQFS